MGPSKQLLNGPSTSSALICLTAIAALVLPAESWPSSASSVGGIGNNQQQQQQQRSINSAQQMTGYVQTRPFNWSTFGVLPNDAGAKAQLSPQQPHGSSASVQATKPAGLVVESSGGQRFRRETETGISGNSSSSSRFWPIGDKKPKYPQQSMAECLKAHNRRRRQHGVPDLTWDSKLAAYAQKHSNWMARTGSFEHSRNSPYGECLVWYSSHSTSCTTLVDRWYNEIKLYNFNRPVFDMETGHFTQLVWRSSKRLGCGIAHGSRGVYLTCSYDPPGNFVGRFRENVPPPLKKPYDAEQPEEPAKPAPVSPAVTPATTATTTTTTTTTTTARPDTTTLASGYPSSVTPLPNDKEAPTTKPKSKKKKKKSNKKKGDKDKKKNKNKRKNKKKANKKKSSTTTTPAPAPVSVGNTTTTGSQVDTTTKAPGSISS